MIQLLAPSIKRIVGKIVPWLDDAPDENQIVLGSMIRLSRNMESLPFPGHSPENILNTVMETISKVLQANEQKRNKWNCISMQECSPLEADILKERCLISADFAKQPKCRYLFFKNNEKLSIAVNGDDHFRIQICESGNVLRKLWKKISEEDDMIARSISYAYQPRIGYLTADPSISGTGMKASILLHIPACFMSGENEKLTKAMDALGFEIRGFITKEPDPGNGLVVISNRTTSGESEERLLARLEETGEKITERELYLRNMLCGLRPDSISDICGRAYGRGSFAFQISTEETLKLLSAMRLGCDLGLFRFFTPYLLNRLMISVQPAHLSAMNGEVLEQEDCLRRRADFLRGALRLMKDFVEND